MKDIKKVGSRKAFVLIFLMAIFISGLVCMGANMEKEKYKKIYVITEKAETRITVHGPGEFSIKIKSSPGTGYSWAVQEIKEGSPIKFLRRVDEEDQPEDPNNTGDQKSMVQETAYDMFTFEALEPGKVEVYLNYRRPWEKDVPPIKKHKIYITVE